MLSGGGGGGGDKTFLFTGVGRTKAGQRQDQWFEGGGGGGGGGGVVVFLFVLFVFGRQNCWGRCFWFWCVCCCSVKKEIGRFMKQRLPKKAEVEVVWVGGWLGVGVVEWGVWGCGGGLRWVEGGGREVGVFFWGPRTGTR